MGLHKSQFSKVLKYHSNVAIYTLESLSKKQAKHVAKALQKFKGLPWKIALIVDSTLQHRASLHRENAKRFNHGNGFVIGHQWTNIVLIINDMLIPLRPIPFYSQRYRQYDDLAYLREHDLVFDYLGRWTWELYRSMIALCGRLDGQRLRQQKDRDGHCQQRVEFHYCSG